MKLKLYRPLVIFDLETTGTHVGNDRIVEIFMLKLNPDGSEEKFHTLLNPQMPIPADVVAIHGISDEMVKDKPAFAEIADELLKFIGNCDFAGYNSNRFDFPMLAEEFLRLNIDISAEGRKFIDVHRIFQRKEPRTLAGAVKFYLQEEMENAHSAEADTRYTLRVLEGQLELYSDLEPTADFLHQFSSEGEFADLSGRLSFDKDKNIIFNFGKHKGKKVEEVFRIEPSYYNWMMDGDFARQTKAIISRIKNKLDAEKKQKRAEDERKKLENISALEAKYKKS